MTTRITDLPLEVLCQIITILPYTDVQNMRLVCHKFYAASQDLKILEKEIVIFDEEYYCFQPASLLKSNRIFLHLRLQNYKSFSYDSNVWSHIGPELKSLSLVSCKLTKKQLFAILCNCINLKYLEILTCSIATRSTYGDYIQNITQLFRHLIAFKEGPKRYSNLKELSLSDRCIPQLSCLEILRVEDRLDSRLIKKITNYAPNLKSHGVAEHEIQGYSKVK